MLKKENSLTGEVNINTKDESSLSEFIKRPLPSNEEIEEFEEIVDEEAHDEAVDESLSEIYQDENGDVVDVKKLSIKRKRGFIFWLFSTVFLLAVIAGVSYGLYFLYLNSGSGSQAVKLDIEAKEDVLAGEEFIYTINYANSSNVLLKDVRIEVRYPENFIVLDSTPAPKEKNNVWEFDSIKARSSDSIKIKGKIINKEDIEGAFLVTMTYMPENFSSEFKKEATHTTKIQGIGMDLDFGYSSNAFIGEDNEIIIKLKSQETNYLNNFQIAVDERENLEIIGGKVKEVKDKESEVAIEEEKKGVWRVSGQSDEEIEFNIKYKIKEKLEEKQELIIKFNYTDEEGRPHTFYEEKIDLEVMKSDFNLSLEINDLKSNQSVNLDQTLDYKISYANKGDVDINDVVIMAVMESELLDWASLDDKNKGGEKGNLITWTKEEIPELAEIKGGEEGSIEFSIDVLPFRESDLGKKFEIRSYAQYSFGSSEAESEGEQNEDNRSNTIISKINSDLSIKEEIRYFNEDNIPVGTGPLPPKVGETTSLKVYWTITNNLHELSSAKIELKLPAYVNWDGKNRTSVGTINYDSASNTVTWNVGRLPTTVYRADAEFSISVTPSEDDRDRILVLTPGSRVTAMDAETKSEIIKETSAKTTKLEDDDIASMSNDGRVE